MSLLVAAGALLALAAARELFGARGESAARVARRRSCSRSRR